MFDEPLSNLDATLRSEMRQELLNLHSQLNSTFIYVTHDQTEALSLATKIMVLRDGVIQQIGTPQEIYDSPNNQFVAQFIGVPAMNLKTEIPSKRKRKKYMKTRTIRIIYKFIGAVNL